MNSLTGHETPTLARLFDLGGDEAECPALVVDDETVTYRELMERVAAFSAGIAALGRGRHSRIAINSEKCVDAYAVELASIGSGATFCPLNTDGPRERSAQILADFDPDLMFFGPGAVEPATAQNGSAAALIPARPEGRPTMPAVKENDCAYVIYTSGTSGYPKGVQITYSNLDWFLGAVLARLDIPSGSRWSNHANLAFDLSILDFFGSVATRSTLVALTGPMERAFPARAIADRRLTVWHSVPSIVDNLMRLQAGELGLLATLEVVMLCGEPCRRSWVDYLLEHCSQGVRVFNCYGPTETTVFCTTEELRRGYDFDLEEPNVPIGTPLEGAKLELDQGEETFSELTIAGGGVGAGYLNLRDGERNGYVSAGGGPRYQSGDLVAEVGGRLYFRGRHDNQVKLWGHRFELAEIEAALAEIGIGGAYAVASGNDVILFLTRNDRTSNAAVLEALAHRVPVYAVPRSIVRLDGMPRNANDKVDRAELTRIAATRLGRSE